MGRILATLRQAAADPAMRRLELASAAWMGGDAAFLVGLLVVAYGIGGAGGVAAVALVRTLPSVLLAPVLGSWMGSRPVTTALRWTLAGRVVAVAVLAGALLVGVPLAGVLVLAGVESVTVNLLRPLRSAALPGVARSPEQLVAGNVALTTGDSLAGLLGPLVAGVFLAVGGPVATFIPGLGLTVAALVLVAGVPVVASAGDGAPKPAGSGGGVAPAAAVDRLAGLRWLARSPVRMVIALVTIQRAGRGAMTVLVVAAALDLLALGEPGVGLLTAANGLGGVVGLVATVALIGRERLAPAFVAGLLAWGLGVAAVGVLPVVAVALIGLSLSGLGKNLIDVAGVSLLQRSVPNAMRTRVLGIQEGFVTGALAAGSVLASIGVATVGVASTLFLAGGVLAIAGVLAIPTLRRVDAAGVVPAREAALLRGVPIFELLPLAVIEELAIGLRWRDAAPGDVVIRAGEAGHEFYVVEAGAVEVTPAAGDEAVHRLGVGASFGEIALLRDVPRTATVTAVEASRLAVIDGVRFRAAVMGDRTSLDAADRIIAGYVASDRGVRAG